MSADGLGMEELKAENKRLTKLVAKLEEYQELLSEELSETSGLAFAHGWRSSRVKTGEKLREEISALKVRFEDKSENQLNMPGSEFSSKPMIISTDQQEQGNWSKVMKRFQEKQ